MQKCFSEVYFGFGAYVAFRRPGWIILVLQINITL